MKAEIATGVLVLLVVFSGAPAWFVGVVAALAILAVVAMR